MSDQAGRKRGLDDNDMMPGSKRHKNGVIDLPPRQAYDSDDDDIGEAAFKEFSTQSPSPNPQKFVGDEEQLEDNDSDYDVIDASDETSGGDVLVTVQIGNSSVFTAALEEVANANQQSDEAVTITATYERKSASQCNIQRFEIPGDSSSEAITMSNLPEELSQETTGLIISGMEKGKTGVLTTIVEAMSVEGIEAGGRHDISVPIKDLLSALTQEKNKAVTLYFRETSLQVVIYDMTDASKMQSVKIHAMEREDDNAEDFYDMSMAMSFGQCVFINVTSLHDAVAKARSNDMVMIKVHELILNGKVMRVVQVATKSDLGEKSREFWTVGASEIDTASNCESRATDESDSTVPTQAIIHRNTKLMGVISSMEEKATKDVNMPLARIAADEMKVKRDTSVSMVKKMKAAVEQGKVEDNPETRQAIADQVQVMNDDMEAYNKAFGEINVLNRTIRFNMNRNYRTKVTPDGKNSYRLLSFVTTPQSRLIHLLKPILNTKRIVSLLMSVEPNSYMMIFVPLGGQSKLIKFGICPTE